MEAREIKVTGAREHNLRGISLRIPRGRFVCFTGVSGSGKSSFAFDTLYAEGQRRYLESLSAYARQYLGRLAKPDVDQITGLSPAIAIQQKAGGWNPRSTVGTITQVHDYLRVLFARVGRQHCPSCGKVIRAQTRDQIVARILDRCGDMKVMILAPVVRGQKGEHQDLFDDLLRQGFARARIDGEVMSLRDAPKLARHVRHHIEIVVDRLSISRTVRPRLADAVETALRHGEGTLIVHVARGESESRPAGSPVSPADSARDAFQDLLLSSHYACPTCDVSLEPPTPQLFSFNAPSGMCLTCDGMGETFDFDTDLLVTDPSKSFLQGAIEPMRMRGRLGKWRKHIFQGVAAAAGFDLRSPWSKLSRQARSALLHGLGDRHITFEWKWSGGVWRHGGTFAGVLADLREKHRKAKSPFVRSYYEKYMRRGTCPDCRGGRLNAQARAVRIGKLNINDISSRAIRDVAAFFDGLKLTDLERIIATDVLKEIQGRLQFLCDVGLDYLTLDRTAPTLSGGESQRIRLAGQIGAGLTGVLYILDEPSIGLHARDNDRLLASLGRLRDLGNTVIVVEHDEATMRAADEIVDFGPGPGIRGGRVVARGDIEAIKRSKRSITGKYLRGEEQIEVPRVRRPVPKRRQPPTKKTRKTRPKRP